MRRTRDDQGARDAATRDLITEELGAAMRKLTQDMPNVPADAVLRMAIGYFAGIYAQTFGHAATVRALITITRRGVFQAAQELAASDDAAAAQIVKD